MLDVFCWKVVLRQNKKVIRSTRDSASSGTLSFWVRACVLSRGSLHFACFLLNSCSSSKLKGHREHAGFGLLRDPLFLGRPKEKKKEKEEKEEKKKQKKKKKKKKQKKKEERRRRRRRRRTKRTL